MSQNCEMSNNEALRQMCESRCTDILPNNIFTNLQERTVLSAVPKMKPSFERKHKSPCTILQAAENKAVTGNHRKQVLSTPASEVRVQGRLEVEQSLS